MDTLTTGLSKVLKVDRTSIDNLITSVVRTVVPIVVGTLLALIIKHFPGLADNLDQAEISQWLIPLVISVYYGLMRTLEEKYPSFGWLLGTPKRPGYATEDAPPPQPAPNDEDEQPVVEPAKPPVKKAAPRTTKKAAVKTAAKKTTVKKATKRA